MKPWTKEETDILIQNFKDKPRDFLTKKISKSWKSIERKAERLKLKRDRLPIYPQLSYIPHWLIGEVLSDGHITTNGSYSHTTKYLEYGEYLVSKLKDIGVDSSIYDSSYFDTRTNKQYTRTSIKTRPVFRLQRQVFYPNGKKIIPNNIKINDEMFKHMLIGDGSINKNGDAMYLAVTMNSENICIQTFINMLKEYGLNPSLRKDKCISIKKDRSRERIKEFYKNVDYIPSCYRYKFDRLKKWINKGDN